MRMIYLAIVFALSWSACLAEEWVPQRSAIVSQDIDYLGTDIQAIFDTTLPACQAACLDNGLCRAFTFNQRSDACFLKAEVLQTAPYEGAISAHITELSAITMLMSQQRAAEVSFLDIGLFERALALGEAIGQLHPANEFGTPDLVASAFAARAGGKAFEAMALMGAAASVSGRSEHWLEYARLALVAQGDNRAQTRTIRRRALPATLSAYLRADGDKLQAEILAQLARALEQENQGADMVPVLRLAQSQAPNRQTEQALERAIGLYGFRVLDTDVQSDLAAPRVCISFSEPLVQAGLDYATYLRLPSQSLTVEAQGRQLCVDGLTHGQRLQMQLRPGLPAASGEVLERPVELSLYVRDRSPAVRFTSRAYLLPRLGDIALPVETVNLTELELTLLHVSDRNLIRSMQEDFFASPLYPWRADQFEQQLASEIWHGTADVPQTLNQDMLTRLPLDEALAGQPAGIYVLTAAIPGADPQENPPATQWFVVSDIGISTLQGTDGLTVVVRGLGDAQAKAGVEVTLLSRANAVLGQAQTNAQGVAVFAAGLTRGTGSAAPGMVTVTDGADDMAFLSLTEPAFDLSDRGVEGRPSAPPIDVFITTDRGAYRAGETIWITALMRDDQAAGLAGIPLTARLIRPDGVEYSRQSSSGAAQAGGHVFGLQVGATAPRGSWRIELAVEEGATLASTGVLVEDFLPERIDVVLALDGPINTQNGAPELGVQARYLFGPPAADLPIEGDVLLRAAAQIEGFDGYVFGLYDVPFEARAEGFGGFVTGADGAALVVLNLPRHSGNPQPLEALITARVTEGSGRPVERQRVVPVSPNAPFIGIKPSFEGTLAQGTQAQFSLIGLGADLAPAPMQVEWVINRVRTTYQWYSLGGRWNWEPVTRRQRVASGTASLGGAPVDVGATVDWGRYEIVVERQGADWAAASTSFYAGWFAPANAATTPDLLEASLDAASYVSGDMATLRIVPRYAGTALITVMSNRVISLHSVDVIEGENLIELPVTDEWSAGAYVSATVIRPMDVPAGHNPARALGLSYASVAPGNKALEVRINAPEAMRPNGRLDVSVMVEGLAPGETGYVTLAAVDVGILNLTGFDSPDPLGHYFGQRKLGVEIRDIYGRLIDGMTGARGVVRSGGDVSAQVGAQAPPPTEDLLAYFTGPVVVGADGRANISFDIPGFNGAIRLMAVAWSPRGVGQAVAEVTVADPVVISASLPRFMAPDDRSRLLVELIHADGPARSAQVVVTAGAGLALADVGPVLASWTDAGGHWSGSFDLTALSPGTHEVTIVVTTDAGDVLTKVLRLPVMINDPETAQTQRFSLPAGESYVFDNTIFTGLMPGTGSATLAVGSLARFDAPGLLNALDRYPYGCTEQITSRALPLLYMARVAEAMGVADAPPVAERVSQALQDVLGNQAANGAFGLWGAYSGDLWLDAYVTDFLSRARQEGFSVPDLALNNALDNLQNQANYASDFEDGGQDIAYALMVLAREGRAAIGDLRYYADEKRTDFATPMAAAQLGAALAYYGDQLRADRMFARAGQMIAQSDQAAERRAWRGDYGSARRDIAAVLALAIEAGSEAVDREALALRVVRSAGAASTQEAVWTLLAANAMIGDLGHSGISINGGVPDGPVVWRRDAGQAGAPLVIANNGDGPTEITLTTFGVAVEPGPASGNGYSIRRQYFTLEGREVAMATVAQGTRLAVVLTVTPHGEAAARLMVNDPLPAGFEIDNPNLLRSGELRQLGWLHPAEPENAQFRQERFLAAVDLRGPDAFTLAYIIRAVSPGSFHHPAASVEDMYRPQMRAQTDTGRVTVTP
ncbi:MAG: alpha-2-macroglobulin family protein [Rhodobacteraceae bacterium]|nr:alpha-2-macroglobulin family protein [Paracoccaceae bacterium]